MNPKRTFHICLLALAVIMGGTGLLLLTGAPLPRARAAVRAVVPLPRASADGEAAVRPAPLALAAEDPSPPDEPVKLIFIHHSCGENWLNDSNGGLGIALRDANYFVSDTNYGWGPDGIGNNTDIPDWPDWFTGPNAITYTTALYTEYDQHSSYARLASDPGGENEIIMFKSCYPNSNLYGNPDDPPLSEPDNSLTIANAKAVYNEILTYFEIRQDKLFVVVTAPPLMESETDAAHAANARAFNDWLLNDWLTGYAHDNVAVFDYYNVLTSNDGDPDTNDYDARPVGNHHYWNGSQITHTQTVSNNFSAYPSGDSHPTTAGNQKATAEFVPLLNVYYNRWQGGATCTPLTGVTISGPTTGYTNTAYAFHASLTPSDASPTITYTWDPAPDAGQMSASVTYTWATTGTKIITLAAENCGGSGSGMDTHTITIQARGNYRVYLPLILRNDVAAPPPSDLVQPGDLTYLGAFAYPAGDEWAYSGHALAYYPAGDPGSDDRYPGSLYAAGHAHQDLVGEISIPEPVISDTFDDLPKASVLRPLTDITGGWKDNCTYATDCVYRELDGLEYLPNVDKIVWNLRDWYNTAGHDQDSLGWSELDLTGAQGVWHIGDRPSDDDVFHNAKTSNYLFQAPASFADEHLAGKWLIAGNHREAGALGGSQGPTLYALAPWEGGDEPTSGQNLDALALLYYTEVVECVWEAEGDINENPAPGVCHFPGYRAMDNWEGGVWVETASKSGILIFGRKGLGDNCYGSTDVCGDDPCAPSSGYHAYPYEPQILFYDPEGLKEVLADAREPWEVLPYEAYSPAVVLGGECAILGATAYDREHGFIYVAEREAGLFGETVVHVWQVESEK